MIISRLNAWIPVADLARAKSFYEAVFGWRVFPLDPNYPQMLIWTPDAKDKNEGLLLPTGGFFETDAAKATGVRSGVKIYLLAENIEEKLKEIEKHGGKCLQGKQLIPEDPSGGANATFEDSVGNLMYLYQPADMTMLFKHQCGALHAGDGSYPVHIEIPCLEGKEAATRDFYSKVLGWSWVDMGGYSLWSWDASHVPGTKRTHVALSGGIYPVPSTPKGAQVDLHFTVQNLDDTEALVKAAGGSIIEGLRMGDPKYGYNIQGYDPNGNNIHFMQPAAKEAVDGGESVEKSAAARQMVDGGESVEKSAAAN